MALKLARHGTLVASTVTTVTLTEDVSTIIVRAHGSGSMNVTFNGTAPTVGGDDTARVDAGGALMYASSGGVTTETVKLISSGTPGYSVEAYS